MPNYHIVFFFFFFTQQIDKSSGNLLRRFSFRRRETGWREGGGTFCGRLYFASSYITLVVFWLGLRWVYTIRRTLSVSVMKNSEICFGRMFNGEVTKYLQGVYIYKFYRANRKVEVLYLKSRLIFNSLSSAPPSHLFQPPTKNSLTQWTILENLIIYIEVFTKKFGRET